MVLTLDAIFTHGTHETFVDAFLNEWALMDIGDGAKQLTLFCSR